MDSNQKRIILAILILFSCDYYDDRLTINNHTDHGIVVQAIRTKAASMKDFNNAEYYLEGGIPPNASVSLVKNGKQGWLDFMDVSEESSLHLVVFDIDTMRKYKDVEYLIDKGLFRLYSFDKVSIEKRGWKVVIE